MQAILVFLCFYVGIHFGAINLVLGRYIHSNEKYFLFSAATDTVINNNRKLNDYTQFNKVDILIILLVHGWPLESIKNRITVSDI